MAGRFLELVEIPVINDEEIEILVDSIPLMFKPLLMRIRLYCSLTLLSTHCSTSYLEKRKNTKQGVNEQRGKARGRGAEGPGRLFISS
jgi:hypothetical protein